MSYVILILDKPKRYFVDNYSEYEQINLAHRFTLFKIFLNIKVILENKLKVFKIRKNGKMFRII